MRGPGRSRRRFFHSARSRGLRASRSCAKGMRGSWLPSRCAWSRGRAWARDCEGAPGASRARASRRSLLSRSNVSSVEKWSVSQRIGHREDHRCPRVCVGGCAASGRRRARPRPPRQAGRPRGIVRRARVRAAWGSWVRGAAAPVPPWALCVLFFLRPLRCRNPPQSRTRRRPAVSAHF